jgi:predicted NBD/HSP70 family sugar kinase
MPVASSDPAREPTTQLISRASIYQLERRVAEAGLDPSSIWKTPNAWDEFGAPFERWIEDVASALAQASIAALSVIDVAAIVIDGAMPIAVREELCLRVAAHIEKLDRRGLSDAKIMAGVVGADARAIGAAVLPLIKNFARDREVLFKDAPNGAG